MERVTVRRILLEGGLAVSNESLPLVLVSNTDSVKFGKSILREGETEKTQKVCDGRKTTDTEPAPLHRELTVSTSALVYPIAIEL